MGVEAVTYEEAKRLTLEFWYRERDKMSLPTRDLPRRIINNQAFSVNAMIANIESNTDIGQWLVGQYISGMGMVISG